MSETVSLIYKGVTPIIFRAPGVLKNVNQGDLIENVSRATYEAELKDDPRYAVVSEKPASKLVSKNKTQQSTESEE
jgi:hypothetical protein